MTTPWALRDDGSAREMGGGFAWDDPNRIGRDQTQETDP